MKISQIERIWFETVPGREWRTLSLNSRQPLPNNLLVRIHTDQRFSGLEETYYLARAVSAVIQGPGFLVKLIRFVPNQQQQSLASA